MLCLKYIGIIYRNIEASNQYRFEQIRKNNIYKRIATCITNIVNFTLYNT